MLLPSMMQHDQHDAMERSNLRETRREDPRSITERLRPVHLLRVFLLRVLESNFPGDSLYNYTDMRIPTP